MASPVVAPLPLGPPPRGFADTCEHPALPASGEGVTPAAVSFDALYDEHFQIVYCSLRRLGVQEAAIDDAVQEVFLVVHRRLAAFEGRSSPKTWLFGIVLHVARTFRRTAKRHPSAGAVLTENGEPMATPSEPLPDEQVERSEAMRALQEILDGFAEDKREVFVLAELEQMTAPEIAEILGIPLTSVYARLRAARRDFEQALVRRRARDAWRQR
jgi:RNA polymerase sigma-70 factor (ECF subfamily)